MFMFPARLFPNAFSVAQCFAFLGSNKDADVRFRTVRVVKPSPASEVPPEAGRGGPA